MSNRYDTQAAKITAWEERNLNGDTFLTVNGVRVACYYRPYYATDRYLVMDCLTDATVSGLMQSEQEARKFCEDYAKSKH